MIRIAPQPEPADFDAKVRRRGHADPKDGRGKWKPHWRACMADLHAAYGGVCAYWSIPVMVDDNARVDHYKPKCLYADDAYEWTNYRLSCDGANRAKWKHEDILDPFDIHTDWFRLSTATWEIAPAAALSPDLKIKVQVTIDRLKLNSQTLRRRRKTLADRVEKCEVRFNILEQDEPYLAWELRRNNWPNAV